MPSIKNRKIALIGGAGFIGHNLALQLKSAGADVHIIDSLQVNNLLAFASTNKNIVNRQLYNAIIQERINKIHDANIPLIVQDAREYHAIGNILNEVNPEVVILLAAVSHAGRSNKDPYNTFDHSLRTLENALDWSREKAQQFIYFSSSMVYGNFEEDSVTEETICNPLGIYGALKYAAEKLVIAYNQVFELPYTIIRPSALYGERCVSRRVGQIFIENAMQGLDITVKGGGDDMLDFTYIDDLVHGIQCCVESEKAKNEIFNITYGSARSIKDMVDLLKAEFPNITIHNQERDSLMPERGTLSIEKAKSLIGYNPQNPLDVGFPKYIEWYKSLFNNFGESAEAVTSQVYE